uniref:Uncharacterized protein n=1 Tax=Physcomitrium patens TaxID=3218 RepID=A0A2K1JNF0_PHYPA|nr:hypothetical protein PHYPA_017728 [Physcomitrium patens]
MQNRLMSADAWLPACTATSGCPLGALHGQAGIDQAVQGAARPGRYPHVPPWLPRRVRLLINAPSLSPPAYMPASPSFRALIPVSACLAVPCRAVPCGDPSPVGPGRQGASKAGD